LQTAADDSIWDAKIWDAKIVKVRVPPSHSQPRISNRRSKISTQAVNPAMIALLLSMKVEGKKG
jgi:hypothetical protein